MQHETHINPAAKVLFDLSGPTRLAHQDLMASMGGQGALVFGEHCSECDYPNCYTTCSFYTPRDDFNCRRFEGGFEPVLGARGFVRVRFRRWGKLEARANHVAVRPTAEAVSAAPSDLAHAAFVPFLLRRRQAYRHTLSQEALAEVGTPDFDAFVLEALSGDGRDHALSLTILAQDKSKTLLYQGHMTARPSYGRLVVPKEEILSKVDLKEPFLVQIEPLDEAQGRTLVFGFAGFVRWAGAPLASVPTAVAPKAASLDPNRPAKVLVWDLDETLWQGVLVDDGLEGVTPRPEAVAAIKALDQRGILQSVASKNTAEETLAALTHFGLADYFLYPQIHWNPKSGSFKALAQQLNLGLDSFVFIDDQPFERAEVTNTLPMVRALPHTAVKDLLAHPWFDVPVTDESQKRRALYQQDALRSLAVEAAGEDYRSFLRDAGMILQIEPLSDANAGRIYELSQRTNQLNFNGKKYSPSEVDDLKLAKDGRVLGLALRCQDRFGDYGLIGFLELDLHAGRIAQFFMSCRVQKKRVEQAFFAWLRTQLLGRGVDQIVVNYTPTARNGAARDMLTQLCFVGQADGTLRRDLKAGFEDADLVKLMDLTGLDGITKGAVG